MENCIFCKIASGSLPSHKLYEDEETVAFLDIHPTNPGHTLVIPKDHFENMYTTPDEIAARLMLTVKKVSVAIRHALECDGVNIIMNNEEAAGQIVFHSHIHIIPRLKNDGLTQFPQGTYKEGEAESIAQKIKEEMVK